MMKDGWGNTSCPADEADSSSMSRAMASREETGTAGSEVNHALPSTSIGMLNGSQVLPLFASSFSGSSAPTAGTCTSPKRATYRACQQYGTQCELILHSRCRWLDKVDKG